MKTEDKEKVLKAAKEKQLFIYWDEKNSDRSSTQRIVAISAGRIPAPLVIFSTEP